MVGTCRGPVTQPVTARSMRRGLTLLMLHAARLCHSACVDGQEDVFAIVSPDWGTVTRVGGIMLQLQLPCCWASASPALSIQIVVVRANRTERNEWRVHQEWRAGASQDCEVMRSTSTIHLSSPGAVTSSRQQFPFWASRPVASNMSLAGQWYVDVNVLQAAELFDSRRTIVHAIAVRLRPTRGFCQGF